jgi:probable rRNA maturation factor
LLRILVQDDNNGRQLVIFQKRVADLTELALDRFVARARRAAGLKGTLNVLMTTSAEMKSLNRRFRGKDKPTDVLSFPAESDGKRQFAGEIAISAEIATKNAHALGHSSAEEIKILVLHGILHLRGYDHEHDKGQMARREKELRAKLRLPSGLIERVSIERTKMEQSPSARMTSASVTSARMKKQRMTRQPTPTPVAARPVTRKH